MRKAYCIFATVLLLAACSGEAIELPPDVDEAGTGSRLYFYNVVHDAAKVKELLSKGADINAKDKEGRTLLHEAAKWRKPEVVKLLIRSGADVNVTNKLGRTPLLLAVLPANITGNSEHISELGKENIKLLLLNGADPNIGDDYGFTPLHGMAYSEDNSELIELYISKGADVNVTTDKGFTPLDYAYCLENRGAAAALLRNGGKLSKPLAFELIEAVEEGDMTKVKELVTRGVDVNACDIHGFTALHFAARDGLCEIAELLITNGADVNIQNTDMIISEPPIVLAANTEIAKVLIAHGADVNLRNDNNGVTVLHRMASQDKKELVELIIAEGADINARDIDEETPLHWAVTGGNSEAVKILVKAGADVNAQDSKGETPLDEANSTEMKELLRRYGAKSGK